MQWLLRLSPMLYLVFVACIGLIAMEIAPSFGFGEIDILYGVAAFVICGLLNSSNCADAEGLQWALGCRRLPKASSVGMHRRNLI